MEADDLILISVDDHICEPATMFDAHVPAKYKDLAPRVVEEENGVQQWWYGDIRGRNMGLNAVAGKPREHFNIDACRYDEMRPGCYDVHERVLDMSAGGQLAGLNFPNWTGFAGQVLNYGPDPDVNEIMIKAYNDWHIDEWCGAYPDRFIPCGILPFFDVERAVREVRRLAAKGCHAVTFSENPDALDLPSLHSGHWDPLLAACSDEGTVICCHVGSSSRSTVTSLDAPPSVTIGLAPVMAIFTFGDLIWADFWKRFPDLRFALTEGDVGWMPYFLSRFEHVHDRHSGWTQHEFPDGQRPTDIFKKHLLCCFISDRIGVQLIEHFNTDNLFWESDFPHSDGTWPRAPESVMETMAGLPADLVNKITHENAMAHYQFDPFRHRPRERCTVRALREEAAGRDLVTRVGRPADDNEAERFLAHRMRSSQAADRPADWAPAR